MSNHNRVTRPQHQGLWPRPADNRGAPPFSSLRPATLLTQENQPQPAPLTYQNLNRLNQATSSRPPADSSRSPPLPGQSSSSSGSLSLNARRINLKLAGVVILFRPPPLEIQSQLDIIWAREQSDERREEVAKIATKLSRKFSRAGAGNWGGDWIGSIVEALEELNLDEFFVTVRKAGMALGLVSSVARA